MSFDLFQDLLMVIGNLSCVIILIPGKEIRYILHIHFSFISKSDSNLEYYFLINLYCWNPIHLYHSTGSYRYTTLVN